MSYCKQTELQYIYVIHATSNKLRFLLDIPLLYHVLNVLLQEGGQV